MIRIPKEAVDALGEQLGLHWHSWIEGVTNEVDTKLKLYHHISHLGWCLLRKDDYNIILKTMSYPTKPNPLWFIGALISGNEVGVAFKALKEHSAFALKVGFTLIIIPHYFSLSMIPGRLRRLVLH